MSVNLNEKVAVLSTLQAAGADVVVSQNQLIVTGVDPIPLYKVQNVAPVASFKGLKNTYTLTSLTTLGSGVTYDGSITQVISGKTYQFGFSVLSSSTEVPNTITDLTLLYDAIESQIQGGITTGQLLGTVSSSVSGVVFAGTNDAPQADWAVNSLLQVAITATTLTSASCTDAAPRVYTSTAHGLTVGGIYRIKFSGVTGAGAADLNGTKIGVVADADTIKLFGTSATGVVGFAGSTATVLPDGDETFARVAGGVTGFLPTTAYVGYLISYIAQADLESGVVSTQWILLDYTNNTTNVFPDFLALQTAVAAFA
jgi:hypothetical protein